MQALLMACLQIPWSLKIFYRLLSDNVPIFSSLRRNHILLNSFLNIVLLSLMMKYGWQQGEYFITLCVFFSAMNTAYCSSVADALSLTAAAYGDAS